MKQGALIAVVLGALALLALGGWIGGELHYRNCLARIEAKYPVAYAQNGVGYGGPQFEFYGEPAKFRTAAIDNCSRWP